MNKRLQIVFLLALLSALGLLALFMGSRPAHAQGPVLDNSQKSAPTEVATGDVFTYRSPSSTAASSLMR